VSGLIAGVTNSQKVSCLWLYKNRTRHQFAIKTSAFKGLSDCLKLRKN
jgi:hypothetical protein